MMSGSPGMGTVPSEFMSTSPPCSQLRVLRDEHGYLLAVEAASPDDGFYRTVFDQTGAYRRRNAPLRYRHHQPHVVGYMGA